MNFRNKFTAIFMALLFPLSVNALTIQVGDNLTSGTAEHTFDRSQTVNATLIDEFIDGVFVESHTISPLSTMTLNSRTAGNYRYVFTDRMPRQCITIFGSSSCFGPYDSPLGEANITSTLAPSRDDIDTREFLAHQYYVRKVDYQNDGLTDFYVTGDSTRAVEDFALIQLLNGTFATVKPSEELTLQGRAGEVVPITVGRMDMNNDSLLDFVFDDVDFVIPGGPESFVVYTMLNTDNTLVVPQYRRTSDEEKIQKWAGILQTVVENWNTQAPVIAQSCNQITTTESVLQTHRVTLIFTFGSFTSNGYQTFDTVYSLFPLLYLAGIDITPVYRDQTFTSIQCGEINGVPPELVKYIYQLHDDGWNPGTAVGCNDLPPGYVCVPSTTEVLAPVATSIWYFWARSLDFYFSELYGPNLHENLAKLYVTSALLSRTDTAVVHEDTAQQFVEVENAPYKDDIRKPENFNSNKPPHEPIRPVLPPPDPAWDEDEYFPPAGDGVGVSKHLEKNAIEQGFQTEKCPAGMQMHHIFAKTREYKKYLDGLNSEVSFKSRDWWLARQCLNNRGIDIDNGGNGICLPKNDKTAKDNGQEGVRHNGPNNELHGKEAASFLRSLCDNATSLRDLQSKLDEVRRILSQGNVPWQL